MGYFCYALKGTKEDNIKSALINLQLYFDADGIKDKNMDYLLELAKDQLEDALNNNKMKADLDEQNEKKDTQSD